MKRRFATGIGIFSAFAFLVTLFIGIGVSSQTIWKEIVPFMGIMLALTFIMAKGSCCRSRRNF